MDFQEELKKVQDTARRNFKIWIKKEKRKGRKDFPLLPFECSWAFEESFRKKWNAS